MNIPLSGKIRQRWHWTNTALSAIAISPARGCSATDILTWLGSMFPCCSRNFRELHWFMKGDLTHYLIFSAVAVNFSKRKIGRVTSSSAS